MVTKETKMFSTVHSRATACNFRNRVLRSRREAGGQGANRARAEIWSLAEPCRSLKSAPDIGSQGSGGARKCAEVTLLYNGRLIPPVRKQCTE
jgi:hypothetical protein